VANEKFLPEFLAHRTKLVQYAIGLVGDAGRAEDIVQDAYLRFRGMQSGIRIDEPLAYFYRIVRNLALDLHRRNKLEGKHFAQGVDAHAQDWPEEKPSAEEALIHRQEFEQVRQAFMALPERTRIALEMHRLEGRTLKEIAAHLGISVSMAQVLVVQGIKQCQRGLT
jgi:RNA polymerase sigma factor (sigma-70 family)